MASTLLMLNSLRSGTESESDRGQGLVEYALILSLVAVVAIVALTGLGAAIVAELGKVTAAL